MRPIYLTRSLSVAADADGIAEAQTPAGAGDLTLDGAFVVDGFALLGAQRKVIITSDGDDTGVNFTIYGTDDQGIAISEVLVGPDTASVQSVLDYSVVTRIAISGAATGSITAGTNGVGASGPIPMDQYTPTFTAMVAVILKSGAVDYTVQYTFDDVFLKYAPYNTNYPGQPAGDPATITWWDSSLAAASANGKFQLDAPVKALRIVTNSGQGEVELQVIQGGWR